MTVASGRRYQLELEAPTERERWLVAFRSAAAHAAFKPPSSLSYSSGLSVASDPIGASPTTDGMRGSVPSLLSWSSWFGGRSRLPLQEPSGEASGGAGRRSSDGDALSVDRLTGGLAAGRGYAEDAQDLAEALERLRACWLQPWAKPLQRP